MDLRTKMTIVTTKNDETQETLMVVDNPAVVPEAESEIIIFKDRGSIPPLKQCCRVRGAMHTYKDLMNRMHHDIVVNVDIVKVEEVEINKKEDTKNG